jgi:hypothetical protein
MGATDVRDAYLAWCTELHTTVTTKACRRADGTGIHQTEAIWNW